MFKSKLKTLTKKQLRRWLLLFFFTLLIPTGLLVQQSYSRLKWETFHQHQQMAQALTTRIDNRLIELINKEDERSFTDYAFLNVAGDVKANFLQRSPLSNYPVTSDIPGIVGYFQVDDLGELKTPLLPEDSAERYGISTQELAERVALKDKITSILATNKLIKQATTTVSTLTDNAMESAVNNTVLSRQSKKNYQPQIAFEQLSDDSLTSRSSGKLGRVEDLQLEQAFQQQIEAFDQKETIQETPETLNKAPIQKQAARARSEKIALPEIASEYENNSGSIFSSSNQTNLAVAEVVATQKLRIRTFESEIDPFEFSQLDSGHFVLFRKVWLNGKRYVQGLLIEEERFVNDLINAPFNVTVLSNMSDLLVAYQGNILTHATNNALSNEQLYRSRLSSPFSDLQLIYRITQLPIGAGGRVVMWLGLILGLILLGGFYLMYRLGLGQIRLAHQQQDFVSAVSHELKTPLTSIRMYGEMLKEGWAPEEKKRQYYDFIFDESERLSRLINNVLQLARMTRNSQQAELAEHDVNFIMNELKSKVSSQVERGGFALTLQCDESIGSKLLMVDMDWLTQVVINLVDNAIKFSANAERKEVVLACSQAKGNRVAITVRDFGEGVDTEQMKQIFELFYRSENELTRETTGTGIGLSLVQQMVNSMHGKVSVENKQPGAAFTVSFLPVS